MSSQIWVLSFSLSRVLSAVEVGRMAGRDGGVSVEDVRDGAVVLSLTLYQWWKRAQKRGPRWGSYGEGNNLHRFCKGNDLAAAISVGVTTVVLRRELLLHRVVGTLLQLAKPVEKTYAPISRKYATNTKCSSRCVVDLIPHSTQKPYISKPIFICFSKRSLPLALTSKQVGSRKITKGGSITVSMSSTCNNQSESGGAGGLTYKDAGVDIDAGSELVRRIAKMAPGIGGFGGLFPLGDSYLVAGTDGVGTKLKLAFETGIHESIGIDLVAMSVNDIVTSGAKPLFFLDYFATSHLDVDLAEKVMKGIVDGCQQSDCALLGGETAEMPDFYADGEYDLSGFAVGIVKKDSVIDGKNITVGDVLVGLPSSGVHSNGFSLVRRVLAQSGLSLNNQLPGEIVTLGEALMAPTVIYVKQVLDIISKGGVKGIAHVTGGGFTDNIPRVFPKGLGALIYKDSWVIPPVFKWIQQAGRIEDSEMRRTFNMGIGMVLVVSQEAAHRILGDAKGAYAAYRIGEVVSGDGVSYQ